MSETKLDTLLVGQSAFKNKLINGNFDFWQRGTSLSSGGGTRYLADRWVNESIGTTYTVGQTAFTADQLDVPLGPSYFYRCAVTSVAGASNYCALLQKVEDVHTLAGKTAVLSFYAKADAAKNIAIDIIQYFGSGGSPGISVPAGKKALTTSWQKFSVTVSVPAITGKTVTTGHYMGIRIWFDAGSTYNTETTTLGQQSGTFDIAQAQLEEGGAPTAFDQRHPQQELALCQRYYEKSYDLDTLPGANTSLGSTYVSIYHGGWPASIAISSLHTTFKVMKRSVPTVTPYSITGVSGQVTGNGASLAASVVVGPSRVSFAAAQNSSNSTGNSTSVFYQWTADAEL